MSASSRLLMGRLRKRARKGPGRHPVATIAHYGPDDRRASKVVASIVQREDAEPSPIEKWFSDQGDVRTDPRILSEIIAFIEAHGARSVVMPDRIIGCPHEQGIDYEGSVCPRCPFWANRDRWTGEVIH